MTKQISLRVLALASVCLAPLAAAAQDFDLSGDAAATAAPKPAPDYKNEIDIGARYQSSTSPLYGRYTGTDSKGFGSLGGFHLEGGDAPDSGKTLHYEATGKNLNFQPDHVGPNNALAPEAELNASIGQQGTWKAGAYYNAITYTGQTFLSPYNASGGLAPGQVPFGGQAQTGVSASGAPIYGAVPTVFGSAGTAGYYASHPYPEFQQTAGTRRDIGGTDGKYIIGDWTIAGAFRHEHKEGTVVQTMYSSNGGMAFPEPVNYDTDRYNVTASYNTRRLQGQLGYTFSKFTDNTPFFVAPYLFATSTSVQPISQYSDPPNNYAHYLNGSAGYNLTDTTRVNGTFQYGIEASDGALGNGTATPGYETGSAAANLAKNISGDQMVRIYNGTLGVTTRPLNKLDIAVNYGIDGRQADNNPLTVYGSEHGDGAAALVGNIVQQSWTKQKATVEAGYKVLDKTKLSVGYRFDDTARNGGAAESLPMSDIGWVGHSTENTAWAKLADHTIANVNSSVTIEHAVRSGTMELPAGSGATSSVAASTGVNPASAASANLSSMPYYEAPRTAERAKFRADYVPSEQWAFGVNAKYETNHYRYTSDITGTQRDYNASAGPDITFSPTKAIALHGFYTYEEIYYDNRGNGQASKFNNNYGWSAATTDSVHTAGLAADWKITDRLKVGTEYTFSYGDIGYNMFDGGLAFNSTTAASYFNVQNLPSVNSSMHSVKVTAEYKLADNVTLMGGYGFDLFKDNDWAYGWAPIYGATSATGVQSVNTFSSAEASPSYRVHSLYTAVRVKF